MTTVLEALAKSYNTLLKKNIKTAKIDSEMILAEILKTSRINLVTKQSLVLNDSQESLFDLFIKRRRKSEPVAYILNKKDFWNETYFVDKRVLIPRPETEILIDMLIKKIKNKSKILQIIDIGCGSGCLLISCLQEFKKSLGLGLDISACALEVAKMNIDTYKLNARAKLLKKNIFSFSTQKKFDLILSNPPYLSLVEYNSLDIGVKKFEPKKALKGGHDGILFYKKIIAFAEINLKTKGVLALELGDGQFVKIKEILTDKSFRINLIHN